MVFCTRIELVRCVSAVFRPLSTERFAVQRFGSVRALTFRQRLEVCQRRRTVYGVHSPLQLVQLMVTLFQHGLTAERHSGHSTHEHASWSLPTRVVRNFFDVSPPTALTYCCVLMEHFGPWTVSDPKRKKKKKSSAPFDNDGEVCDFYRCSGFLGLDPGVVNYVSSRFLTDDFVNSRQGHRCNGEENYTLKNW